MTSTQAPGRSREELLAAAAALTTAMHEVDDPGDAAALAERARQFEDEAMDAAPISAAGQVTDDQLLDIIGMAVATGVTVLLASSSGAQVPEAVSAAVSLRIRDQAMGNTLLRHELLEGARRVLAGGCICGGDHGPGEGQAGS